jgi:CDP-paratose 2-epimerase
VYNIGGGKANSCSILEAFELVSQRTGKPMDWVYSDQARAGDHICYYSDLRRMQADYPGWRPEISLDETFDQIVEAHDRRADSRQVGSTRVVRSETPAKS